MGKELLLRIVWAVGLCVASGATVIVADTWYHGAIKAQDSDSLPVYDPARTAAEIQSSIEALSAAGNLNPGDGATDVPCDATLNWPAGRPADTYDVYFGTSAADVNSATRMDTAGLLVSLGQAATTFDPPVSLAYGQTYYWRVDEVNQSAGGAVYKGAVWSFTVEPFARLVKPVSATASSGQTGMGPEKTFDGSGLTGDQHGTDPTTMWLSTGTQPNWIQYQFDRVHKFHDLKVWNSNQPGEGVLGFGAKGVKIEYCADGITWQALDDVPEFARAPGTVGYAANTTVNFGGVMAKYVRLTIHSTWAGVSAITGLSEVRFSYIPVQAFGPQPADGARGVSVDTTLNWRPGREAASHRLFSGNDQAAVAGGMTAAQTLAEHSFAPGDLNFGRTYYWKVDEVNAVTYAGDVWSFTTQEYAVVDDFESYNDTDHRIYDTWIDGRTDGKSGSVVGYSTAAEGKVDGLPLIHGGQQALALEYNNVKPPYYSETSRTFDTPQNWTAHGADTLALSYRGYEASFFDRGNNAFTIYSGGGDVGGTSDQLHFVYRKLSGAGSITMRVDSVGDTDVWSKAGPMIRETLDPGSKDAYCAVTTGSGVLFQWRDTTNGTTANSQTPGLKAPYWVRITRTGNVFKAERSADGKTWTQQGTDTTITMAPNVYIGMVATSYALVSNVSTTGAVTDPWRNFVIDMVTRMNDPAPLYLMIEDTAGKSKTVGGYFGAETTKDYWYQWTISLSNLSSAGVNLNAVKKLTIGVGDKTNPKPGGTGLIYIDDIGFGHPAPSPRPATRS